MTKHADFYVDLKGRQWDLTTLDHEERRLVKTLQARVKSHPDWNDFDTFWLRKVAAFYDARGLPRKRSMQTTVYQIAQDLSARLAVSLGLVRAPDYRDELREIIRTRFKSQRDFCKATGLSEDMLSHVLSGRKHLAMDSLTQAMERIGYELRIVRFDKTAPRARNHAADVA